jgi:hypothetical protein
MIDTELVQRYAQELVALRAAAGPGAVVRRSAAVLGDIHSELQRRADGQLSEQQLEHTGRLLLIAIQKRQGELLLADEARRRAERRLQQEPLQGLVPARGGGG